MKTSRKQVLFLSIDGMTDALGQSQVLPYLIGLKQKGWGITLISAEKPHRYAAYSDKIRTICSETGIDWQPFIYRSSPPILSALYNLWMMNHMAGRLHKTKRFVLIHCRSYLPALIGMKFKKSLGIPFLFDIRGFWVDEKIDGNIWKLSNPLHRLLFSYFKKKEKTLFNEADIIVSLTEKATHTICRLAGKDELMNRINVIPCCVDTMHFNPDLDWSSQKNLWRRRLDIKEDETVLVYLGSLSTWYLPTHMIRFYETLEKSIPGLRFLIVTGESPEPFQKMLMEEGINQEQVIFTSAQREELPALLSLAKYAVCFYQSSFSRQATSPTKLAELMSMGIPIVCSNNVGDVNEILAETGAGTVCDPFEPKTWPDAATRLIEIAKNKSKSEIRNWAIRLFDVSIGVDKYNSIYEKLNHQS